MSDYYLEVLRLSTAYDLFALIVTFSKMSDIDVTVLCENQSQMAYISSLNSSIKTLLIDPTKVNLNIYDAVYVNHFNSLTKFTRGIIGKTIYIAFAMYNMISDHEKGISLDPKLVFIYGQMNKIELIDLYKNVKWRIPLKEDDA